MTELTLTKMQIKGGLWVGRMTAVAEGNYQPDLDVTHLDAPVAGVSVAQVPSERHTWTVTVPIPPTALNEGVQTVLIRDRRSGARLASFTIVTGEPLEDDIRAEVDLLRAELDMLKKAFRRHCIETAG